MDIKAALATLDPKNNEHWTADGLARVDVVAGLVGNDKLKRKDITDADPEFIRPEIVAGDDTAGAGEGAADNGTTQENGDQANALTSEQTQTAPPSTATSESSGDGAGDNSNNGADSGGDDSSEQAGSGEQLGDDQLGGEGNELDDEDDEDENLFTCELAMEITAEEFAEDLSMCAPAAAAINERIAEIDKAMVKVKAERERLLAGSQAIDALHARLTPKQNPVMDFIKSQNANRAAKAAKAKAFLDAGTSAKDLVGALQSKSPLDAAMSQRKAGRGTARPPARLMGQQNKE